MRKISVVLSILLMSWAVQAQMLEIPLADYAQRAITLQTDTLGSPVHFGIRPLLAQQVSGSQWYQENWRRDYWKDRHMIDFFKKEKPHQLFIQPLVGAWAGVESGDKYDVFSGGELGLRATFKSGKKFEVQVNTIQNAATYPLRVDEYIIDTKKVPSQAYANKDPQLGYTFNNFSGYIGYVPSKHIRLQLGHGKNFWGEGYRSLILSDFAQNYDYFKMVTSFWKINYVNLFTRFKDISEDPSKPQNASAKYGTFHMLSINLGKRWNLAAFESVIWQSQDSLVQRGFDMNYLNPVIYYRPVEWSIGSPDNVLLGAQTSFRASDEIKFYGQIMIDEFVFQELTQESGSWRNKYAYQAGVKWYNAFGVKNLGSLLEGNWIRPYMYSHSDVRTNYGHFNEPLAHPGGANLKEFVNIWWWNYQRFYGEAKLIYKLQGLDNDTSNYGADIYKPYTTRSVEDDSFIGQGEQLRQFSLRFRASYMIEPKARLNAFIQYAYTYSKPMSGVASNNYFITFGVETALFNRYFDF